MSPKPKSPLVAARRALLKHALSYPGAYEDFPWGESVAKVSGKVFAFMGSDDPDELGFSVKLPKGGLIALGLPFAAPTGYGLGNSGWVTVSLGRKDRVPLELLEKWIDESYRAVAPKKLVQELDAPRPAGAKGAKRGRNRSGPP